MLPKEKSSEMYGIFHTSSDGYTYNCETLIGIFSTEDEAETALLESLEYQNERERIHKEYQALLVKYNNSKDFENLSKTLDRYQNWKDGNLDFDTDIDNYRVRSLEIGKIELAGL